jgi:hypothetical protein
MTIASGFADLLQDLSGHAGVLRGIALGGDASKPPAMDLSVLPASRIERRGYRIAPAANL